MTQDGPIEPRTSRRTCLVTQCGIAYRVPGRLRHYLRCLEHEQFTIGTRHNGNHSQFHPVEYSGLFYLGGTDCPYDRGRWRWDIRSKTAGTALHRALECCGFARIQRQTGNGAEEHGTSRSEPPDGDVPQWFTCDRRQQPTGFLHSSNRGNGSRADDNAIEFGDNGHSVYGRRVHELDPVDRAIRQLLV